MKTKSEKYIKIEEKITSKVELHEGMILIFINCFINVESSANQYRCMRNRNLDKDKSHMGKPDMSEGYKSNRV